MAALLECVLPNKKVIMNTHCSGWMSIGEVKFENMLNTVGGKSRARQDCSKHPRATQDNTVTCARKCTYVIAQEHKVSLGMTQCGLWWLLP